MTTNDGPTPDAAPRLSPDEADLLLGAYALDALDEGESAALEQYLATHPEARREGARLRDAVDEIITAGAVTPPTALWDRIAAELPTVNPVNVPGHQIDELAARRASRVVKRRGFVVAAVAAAVILFAGIALGRSTDNNGRGDVAAQLRATADQNAQHGGRVATLSGTGGEVRVVVDATGRAIVEPDLPAVTGGRTYQLWALDGAVPVSLGLLGASPTITMISVGAANRFAVTVEPGAGSKEPTSPPVAVGQLI